MGFIDRLWVHFYGKKGEGTKESSMKVKDLIKSLKEYNPEADVHVVVESKPMDFEICYGSSEGCTKENAEDVSLFVVEMNDKDT